MSNRENLRTLYPVDPAEPTVVVDGLHLVDESTIGSSRIRLLMRDAELRGDKSVARLCWLALNEPDQGGEAKRGAAKLWNDRIAAGDEPRGFEEPGDDCDDREPCEDWRLRARALRWPGSVAGIANDGIARETGEGDPGEDEHTTTRPLVLSLVEFHCPSCHHPVIASDDRGILRVPWHRTHEPIFPFGYGGPPYRAECPASLMEITQVCDGQHGASSCDDPQCWHGPGDEESQDDRTSALGRERWKIGERTTASPSYVDQGGDPDGSADAKIPHGKIA